MILWRAACVASHRMACNECIIGRHVRLHSRIKRVRAGRIAKLWMEQRNIRYHKFLSFHYTCWRENTQTSNTTPLRRREEEINHTRRKLYQEENEGLNRWPEGSISIPRMWTVSRRHRNIPKAHRHTAEPAAALGTWPPAVGTSSSWIAVDTARGSADRHNSDEEARDEDVVVDVDYEFS